MQDFIEYKLKAYHLKNNIDISECRKQLLDMEIAGSKGEVFYQYDAEKYAYVFNYGVVVFYNFRKEEINQELQRLFPEIEKEGLLKDDFALLLNAEDDMNIKFNHLSLAIINEGVIKIVMLNLAQSLALNYYDQVSQELLVKIKVFTNQMEEEGKLEIGRKNIQKFIGRALNTQNKIAENLYIFDAPPVTWENEYLEQVNRVLSRHFDSGPRYRSIENTFKIVEANLQAFMELSHHKESSKLEWIIIILILVEIIDTFVTKLL
ncbi:RMD1 family protein [Fulvivirga sediminis]|uniref:RMD1 family protein n=1 Tax=Fulvivirga sediminis TaxID=2803949 RepID=A0A937K1Q7_9BACT|nr:RMD1 family protein [Fulvivirga sediminis]MBL3656952.1 RMD1 family protein [Fulvivirga sediminis]